MKLDSIRKLLRVLFVILGAGIGAALAATAIWVGRTSNPDLDMNPSGVLLIYMLCITIFALIFFLFSLRMADGLMNLGSGLYRRIETLPLPQLLSATLCMILGQCVAALITPTLHFMGSSMFTMAFSSIMLVCFSVLGYMVGRSRYEELMQMLQRIFRHSGWHVTRRKIRKASRRSQESQPLPFLVDTSVLIDGRIPELCHTGFIQGVLVVPDFVILELQHLADSADPAKRTKGRRGMDIMESLKQDAQIQLKVMTSHTADEDADMRLLELARDLGAPIITCDTNLARAGTLSGLRVLNLHELATVMKPTILNGDTLDVTIVKEGREQGQGIAYLEDGTMIVVENGRSRVGEALTVQVTTTLQTNAGRMIFARILES